MIRAWPAVVCAVVGISERVALAGRRAVLPAARLGRQWRPAISRPGRGRGRQAVGEVVWYPLPDQETAALAWFGIEQSYRGLRFGSYLLDRALVEMAGRGYLKCGSARAHATSSRGLRHVSPSRVPGDRLLGQPGQDLKFASTAARWAEPELRGKCSMLVLKFGGTSVGDAKAIRQTVSIICDQARSRPSHGRGHFRHARGDGSADRFGPRRGGGRPAALAGCPASPDQPAP